MSIKYYILTSAFLFLTILTLACGESAGEDFSICENNLPTNLGSNSDTFWSGDGVDASGLFNPDSAGEYTLTLHTSSLTCTDTDEVTITVLESPTVEAGADELICVFDVFQINATASSPNGNIVVWSWSGDDQFLNSTNIPNPTATPSGSSSFNLTVADEAGCASFDQINLTTAPLPNVSAGSNFEMCNVNEPQNLAGIPAGGIWQGPGIAGNTFVSPGTGTHNLEYSYTDSNGCSNSDMISVEVSELPAIDAGSMVELCSNGDVHTLTGHTPASNVTWSGAGVVNQTDGIIDPTAMPVGANMVTMIHGENTCQVSAEREVFVHDLPEVTLDAEYNVCQNEIGVELTNNSPAGGSWSGLAITDEDLGSVDSNLGVGSYSVVYTYQNPTTNCVNSASSNLEIRPVPEANFTVESLSCIDSPLEINNSTPSNLDFSWYVDGALVSNEPNPSIELNAEGTYVVNLEVVSDYGCFDEGVSQNVELISAPTASFSLDTNNGCEPLIVQAQNESTGSYLSHSWDFSTSSSADENPPSVNYGDIEEDSDYEIELTIENICGTSQYSEIASAIALPQAEFQTHMTLLCSPALVEFENNSSTNSDSYNWMLGDGDSSIDQNPEAKIYTAGNVSEEYSITLEVSNECGSSSATQDITVLPNVVEAGFSSSHIEACAPVNIEFLDSSINTTQIQYDFNGELVSGTNIQREFEIEGVYEVLQYATDGCGFDTTSLEITVFPAPIMDIQILENEICLGESFGFQFLGEELSLTEWTVNGDMVSNSVMDDFTPNLSGEYTIGFQGETALNACEISVSNQIEVRPIPGLELSEDYFSGCSPLSIQLENSADAAENNTYIWQAGDQSSTQHYPSFDFSNPGIYDLEVHAENGFGCSAELNLAEAIEVFTTPVASFDYSPDELDILYNSEVSFSNTSEGGSLYHWNFGDGSESLEINPTHTYEEAGLFPVSLVVTNEHNCIDEFVSGVELEEQFSLFIPNSFTPNSDGINEVFRPQFLGLDYLEYSFIVYDRWGTIIFESYQEDEGWYGNVKNGNHYAASGVYTYEIVFTLPFGQGNKVYGGTVSLIR